MARRVELRLKFQNVKVPADINKYLSSLTFTDEDEDNADDLQLAFDDRERKWLGSWLEVKPTFIKTTTTVQKQVEAASVVNYVVKKGDTLWAIAKKYLGSGTKYPQIASENNIKNPNLIYPGQVFKITTGGTATQTVTETKETTRESLTLNKRLNSENRAGNIQALKNDLRKTKELLQSEKEKTHTVQAMTEECQDKLRQAEQERDYALSHQKKVEIPVEKPVLYQKCGNCNLTAYLKAKEKYDTQREKLAGRYKTKTAMYEALMFLLIWYSVSTTLFQMIRSKIFISDCVVFFDTIATFIQTIAGWIILTGITNLCHVLSCQYNPPCNGLYKSGDCIKEYHAIRNKYF